jgi:hypothetical protein
LIAKLYFTGYKPRFQELFEDEELKKNFADLFVQVDPNVQLTYLKGFCRIRIRFERPELATTAKVLVEHHQFQGIQMKAYFAQVSLRL